MTDFVSCYMFGNYDCMVKIRAVIFGFGKSPAKRVVPLRLLSVVMTFFRVRFGGFCLKKRFPF